MIDVGVLGATGLVGEQYLALLENHPYFRLTFLAASNPSQHLSDVCKNAPRSFAHLPVFSVEECEKARNCLIIFSALPSQVAKTYDWLYAQCGCFVISSSSLHRMEEDVPLIIPEVNLAHLQLLEYQRKKRKLHQGGVIAKPNCSLQSYVLPLTPLHQLVGIEAIVVNTYQAVSGAGRNGIGALDMIDNLVPWIKDEEQKSSTEPQKIWGEFLDGRVAFADIPISTQCSRAPLVDGHMAFVGVRLKKPLDNAAIVEIWERYRPIDFPSSPRPLLQYFSAPDRPQPRLDRSLGKGMAISIGRLQKCPVLGHKFVALSHNRIRGAAGGGVLIAEAIKSVLALQ